MTATALVYRMVIALAMYRADKQTQKKGNAVI